MSTPYRRHQERVRQQQQAEAARAAIAEKRAPEPLADVAATMAAIDVNLDADLARISNTPQPARAALKADLLKGYMPSVRKYLDADEVYANQALVMCMIWGFDLLEEQHPAGDIVATMELATAAVEQGQKMPQRFNRDLPTFVADAVRLWAEQQIKLGHSPEPAFSQVFAKLEHWPVPKPVLMKYHKVAANIALDASDWERAYTLLLKADLLSTPKHPAKVSTKLALAKKELEKQGKALPSVQRQGADTPAQDAPEMKDQSTDDSDMDEKGNAASGTDATTEQPATE
ncbi:phage terminase small subunit [Oceanobacter mangrovi]|uniref:phage terminase small subunit n=1 Tax=Oceanobacter mangrovi TaxID=2862510 RepID=UPI001C8D6419|nr:phage terminase small subunit [Oceanobacter mangrovi]